MGLTQKVIPTARGFTPRAVSFVNQEPWRKSVSLQGSDALFTMSILFKHTPITVAAFALLVFSADAQTLNDPGKAIAKDPAAVAQAQQGALATRDISNGDVKAPDGILRVREATMYLKGGKLTRVSSELKLSEGITAQPNGEVTLKDGRKMTLQEGQMLTLDGRVTLAPTGLGSTAPGSASSQVPSSTGNKTDYGNSGVTGPKVPAAK